MITIDLVNKDIWNEFLNEGEDLCNNIAKKVLSDNKIFLTKAIEVEISVNLTNDQEIRELNKTYRNKDKATNVLSFPLGADIDEEYLHLGDVVISFETLAMEAKNYERSFRDHFSHMFLHGLLHLLGYDHEEESERDDMEKIEIDILKSLDIGNPYLI